MDILSFAILCMAAWRIASLLVREQGPWRMFVWIRERAGIQHDDKGTPWLIPDNVLAGILSCTWCASVWIGMFWVGFFLISPLLATKIATIFAISTGAILIDKWTGN